MRRYWFVGGLALGAAIAYACSFDTPVGPGLAIDSLYIEPASASMVVDDTLHLVAVGVDSNGHRFAYALATWSSSDPVVTVLANGSVIGAGVGMGTVAAHAGGITATASVTVTPKPTIALPSDSALFGGFANGPDPAAQRLAITNGGGGTLSPVVDSVRYVSGAGWLQASIAHSGGTDTLQLVVSTATLSVGSYTANVFLNSPKATPKTFKVRLAVGVDAPATLAIDSGEAQTATVNSAVAVKPTVLVRDQFSNPVPSATVTFNVTGGGGTVNPVTGVATDANGRARATSWTLGTTAGANTLQAATTGVSSVTFHATGTAGAPATAAKNAGDAQSVTVNSAVPVKPTLLVTDQFGNPVESVTVTFAVATGNGGITGATKKTDGSGLAPVGSWTLGKVAGANSLSATAASLAPQSFSATGNADVADSIKLSAGNNQTDTVKATLGSYSVRVADQYGNPVFGTSVNWAATGGGSITASSVTNASGIASATRVFGTAAGAQNATATVAGLVGSPVAFSATANHGAATTIVKVAGDNQSATAGANVGIAPSAKVTDQYGNPVAGLGMTFAVTAGGGSVTPVTAITTDAAGTATVTSWTLGPGAGSNNNTLRASVTGLTSVNFTASGLSGSAKNLVFVSNTGLDTIGAPRSYTVKVTDINNNPVQGIPVGWAVTRGGGSIPSSSVSDVNGLATATRVLGTTVGLDSATASVGGLTGSPVGFGETVVHGNPNQISKTAGDGQSATVASAVATAPQVRIFDRAGNTISGASVTFTLASGGGSTSPGSPAGLSTDANGFAQLTSWTLGSGAGSNTISVASSGTPGATFSATGTPDVPNAGTSTLSAGTASIAVCSAGCVAGSTASTVTITVRDQFSNVISGASVTPASSGSSNTFSPASGTTNGSGVFTANFNSTLAQGKTISATAGGTGITQTAGVTVNPAGVSAAQSTVAAGTASIAACSTACVVGSTASTITITVRDAFTNVISGASVTPASSGSTNTFSPASGSTNGSGVFTTNFNSTLAQVKTISATANAVGITGTAGVTVNAAAPASVSVGNTGYSVRVGTDVGSYPTYTVRDAFSNVVPSYPVSYSSSFSGGFGTSSSTTNASGQVSLTSWTMAGTNSDDAFGRFANNVTVTANGFTGTATDYGIYTYSGDAAPILNGCTGCHYAAWSYANIVGVTQQDGAGYTSCTTVNSAPLLVSAGNANASLIYLKTAAAPSCGSAMPAAGGLSAAQRTILRAWINNGAPNN